MIPLDSYILEEGFKKVLSEDRETQEHCIKEIASSMRKVDPSVIHNMGGVWIPNNEYMKEYWGPKILDPSFDCYTYEECNWSNNIIFPIRNVLGDIVGLVGYNPINKLLSEQEENFHLRVYRNTGRKFMDKGKYIFCRDGVIKEAIEEGYLIITDGLFDTASANNEGLLAGALLGSNLSDEYKVILSFIKTIYIAEDNDKAGKNLARRLKAAHPDVRRLKFNKFKDLDDVLKSEYAEEFKRVFLTDLGNPVNKDIRFRF